MKLPSALFKNLGSTSWEPRVFSSAMLKAGRTNPSAWAELPAAIAGFDVNAMLGAEQWAQSEQIALFRMGTGSLGLPQSFVPLIENAIVPLALGAPKNVGALASQLTATTIGAVTNALSVSAVVGPIAGAIGAIVALLKQLNDYEPPKRKEILPPAQEFESDLERDTMNVQILPALTTADWTGLFRPRQNNNPKVIELDDGGYLLTSHGSGSGAGMIPGARGIVDTVRTYWVETATWPVLAHQDTGDFYPGPAQLLTAVAEQVMKPGALMYTVNPHQVLSAWQDHVGGVLEFAEDLWNGKGLEGTGLSMVTTEQRRMAVKQLVAPYFVGQIGEELYRGKLHANDWSPGKQGMKSILDAFIEPWCKKLAKRQEYFLGTTVCALVDPDSGSFRHDALEEQMVEMRKLLLKSPERWNVPQSDVIDAAYASDLWKKTSGGTLVAPGYGQQTGMSAGVPMIFVPPPSPDAVPEPHGAPPAEPSSGAPPFQNPGEGPRNTALGLVVLGLVGAGALAGGVAVARRLQR